MEISDEALCERVATRDEAAFDVLVARYQERAYRLAWSILRNAEDARDLSQEAFIRLHEKAASFGGRARFATWFFRILVNLCLDHRRRHRWWHGVLASTPDGAQGPGIEEYPAVIAHPVDELVKEQTSKALWAAVDRLSPQQRAAVVLQVQEGLAPGEIAGILGCSESTVRVHLHRALTALRKTVGRRRP